MFIKDDLNILPFLDHSTISSLFLSGSKCEVFSCVYSVLSNQISTENIQGTI